MHATSQKCSALIPTIGHFFGVIKAPKELNLLHNSCPSVVQNSSSVPIPWWKVISFTSTCSSCQELKGLRGPVLSMFPLRPKVCGRLCESGKLASWSHRASSGLQLFFQSSFSVFSFSWTCLHQARPAMLMSYSELHLLLWQFALVVIVRSRYNACTSLLVHLSTASR